VYTEQIKIIKPDGHKYQERLIATQGKLSRKHQLPLAAPMIVRVNRKMLTMSR